MPAKRGATRGNRPTRVTRGSTRLEGGGQSLEFVMVTPGIPESSCRVVGSSRAVALETSGGIDAVPGELVTCRLGC